MDHVPHLHALLVTVIASLLDKLPIRFQLPPIGLEFVFGIILGLHVLDLELGEGA